MKRIILSYWQVTIVQGILTKENQDQIKKLMKQHTQMQV